MTLLVDARSLTPTTEQLESDVPNIETAAYQRTVERLQLCRDVYAGTEAIRAAGTDYLPQFRGESDSLYEARSTISGFFNGFARTIQAATGLLTQPEPVLSEEMPETLVEMWENVDGAGMHGAVFTKQLAKWGMLDGYAGVLVEYPRANDPTIDRSRASAEADIALEEGKAMNAGDEAAIGLRPYFILIKVDECLPIYATINGQRTLVLFIWRHPVTERPNRFSLKTVMRYNVYELRDGKVMYERWTESLGGRATRDEEPTEMKGLTAIPFSPMPVGEQLGEHEYKPTLIDLAYLNITHHRIATGILSLEEQACVVTPVRIGAPPNADGTYPDLVVGAGNSIEIPLPSAGQTLPPQPVYYLSPPVDVIQPAMTSLENCKAEMGAMGAAFLAPQPVQETAAAKRMDARAESASIGSVARALKDCLELAFDFAGQYVKQDAGSITTNSDFTGEGVSPEYLTVCVSAFQAGALTLEELRHVIQTGELPEDFESGDEKILTELAGQAAAKAAQKELERQAQLEGQPNGPQNQQQNVPDQGNAA